jgi:hypothetical protein
MLGHRWAADAVNSGIGQHQPQAREHAAREQVTGSFSGYHRESQVSG